MNLRSILYPTDFSDANRPVLTIASALARDHDSEMLIAHVHETPLPHASRTGATAAVADFAVTDADVADLQKQLLEVRPLDPSITCQHKLMHGAPSDAILKLAQDENIDLIVMGTHGRGGITRLLMGSVAESVVRRASCPVLTLKRGEEAATPTNFRKILFPTDLSERSNSAIGFAASMARGFDAELILLHVDHTSLGYGGGEMHYAMAKPTVDELKAQLERVSPPVSDVRCSRHVQTGDPAATIESFAKQHKVDLIVMPTHGRTGLLRVLMGSVAEAVVRRAACPVLTVRLEAVEDSTLADNTEPQQPPKSDAT